MAVSVNDYLSIESTDAATNTARIKYIVDCITTGESHNLNTQTGDFSIDDEDFEESYQLPSYSTTTVFNETITVYNASGRTISASYSFPTTPAGGTKRGGSSVTVPELTRYPEITVSLASESYNSATINWSTDINVKTFQYKINSGSWVDAETNINKRSGSFTIPGLQPNTAYTLSFDALAVDGDWSTHGGKGKSLSVTTYDIGRMSNVNGFNHGSNETLTVTNLSGASLSLEMKINDNLILTRTPTTGSNTITFSQEELDTIYRLYGSSNSLTATFILKTGTYTDTKTATITLTGNQKTAHVSQGRCKAYVGVNGEVKQAVIWVGNNGNRRCI